MVNESARERTQDDKDSRELLLRLLPVSSSLAGLAVGGSGVSAAAWVLGRYSSIAWFAMAAPALLARDASGGFIVHVHVASDRP